MWVEGEPLGQAGVCHMRSQEFALMPVRILVTRHGGCFHLLKETGGRAGHSSYPGWGKDCWEAGHTAVAEAGRFAA